MPALPIYVADFETTTDPEDCRVWAYGIANINAPDKVDIGNSLIGFIRYVAKRKSIVYFHNLKFDGTFIIDWLLNHEYEYTDERYLAPKQFTALYSSTGKMYSVKVRWGRTTTTEFRDSMKKLPMGVKRLAKAFNTPVVKGELDYHKYRPIGHTITDDERVYIEGDVRIVAHAVKETTEQGMKKLTIGSDSMAEYKHILGANRFKLNFPVLDAETDNRIRMAYRGGYTYADERYRGRLHKCSGVVLDVNSLYPSVMYNESLPYGLPVEFDGVPDWKSPRLKIFEVTFTAKIKPRHIPIIQVKKSFQFHEAEYLKEIKEPTTLSVTSVDWELWNEHYDITVLSYSGGYEFTHTRGLFDLYIDKWMEIKRNSTGGLREIAKLHLNSLYGKFATGTDVTGRYPDLTDDHVSWHASDEATRAPVYTAMGAFITAYARAVTIRAAQANYDTFAYADTDSLHLMQSDVPDTLTVHPTELGAWKFEYGFTRALYMRAKAYAEETPEGMVVRMAGVPTDVSEKLTFDDMYPGKVIHGKLVPRNVPGGVVLQGSPYELKYDRLDL